MIYPYKEVLPSISKNTFIADGARIIGDVSIGEGSSVWYNAVIRGDIGRISIGENTNIQDNAVIHVMPNVPCKVGSFVSVGHSAIIHSATVEDHCVIGMGATILNGAVIGKGSMIGAGALVMENQVIESGVVVVGVPGKVIGSCADKLDAINSQALSYRKIWEEDFK